MIIYLKWYYGHKNFGDELLLFGVLDYLKNTFQAKTVYIESQNTAWLQQRFSQNTSLLPAWLVVIPCKKRSNLFTKRDLTVFWWWEAVTDARGFPYNGWTYMFWFFWTIITWKYIVLWGVGTIRFVSTNWLYNLFLWNAQNIIVRDAWSYSIAKKFNKNTTLYHDFAYDVLEKIASKKPKLNQTCIINCNPYIRSPETKSKIIDFAHKYSTYKKIYIPAEIWCDDVFYAQLAQDIPELSLYDRTDYWLQETILLIWSSRVGIAARLHVLLLLDYFWATYTPLIYQKKITKVLLS